MSEYENREPADILFETIPEWKPGALTPEDLVECIQAKIGRPIVGQELADLRSLAEEELEYDRQAWGDSGEEDIQQ